MTDSSEFRKQLDRMRRFYAPLISDAMERLGMPSGALDPSIQAVIERPGEIVCGIAFPARVTPTREYVEIDTLLEMVDAIPTDAFVIVSSDGPIDAALWGGLMSGRARARGAVAAAVNGRVRDVEQIRALDFPVFGTGRCIKDIRRRGFMAKYNVPVYCGGVTIVPGDIVFGDANGVIVIPRERFGAVLAEIESALEQESATKRGLDDGEEARALFDRFGRF